jgi:hypothetical protein
VEIRDIAVLDISNVLVNLEKLEANYKATGARLGSNVRLNLDTASADAKLRELETRLTGLRGKNIPITVEGGAAASVAPHLNQESIKQIETQVIGLAERLTKSLMLTIRLRFEGGDPLSGLISTVMRAVQAIEDLNAVLASGGKITTTYREQTQSVDSVVLNLARAIKQLAQEQKNGQIDAAQLTASMTALRAKVVELSETAVLGSKDALVLGQAYRTASASLGEAALKASPLAASIESIRVRVSGLRAAFQTGEVGEKEFILAAQALISEGKALNVTLEADAVAFRNLQIATRPAVAALDALEGKMSRLGLASQVGLGLGKTNQLLSGFASSLGFLPGPLGLIAVYSQTATSALQGLTAAEIAAAAPAVALGIAIVALAAIIGIGIGDAAKYDAALAQLGAVMGATPADVERLRLAFNQLSEQLPISNLQLVELARNAALVGVHGTDNIIAYTETIAKLSVIMRTASGDVHGTEETVRELAKFLAATGVPTAELGTRVREVGAELVALKAHIGGTIPEILNMASYFASIGKGLKILPDEVLALSSALVSTGAKAQGSGHAIITVIEDLQRAAIRGGQEQNKYATFLGLTNEKFKDLALEHPAQAFGLLSKRIAEATAAGIPLVQVIDTLGIKNKKELQTLGESSAAYAKLSQAIDIATEKRKNQEDLDKKVAQATATFTNDIKLLGNTLQVTGQAIGEGFLPLLDSLVKSLLSNKATVAGVAAAIVELGQGAVGVGQILYGVAQRDFGALVTAGSAIYSIISSDVQAVRDLARALDALKSGNLAGVKQAFDDVGKDLQIARERGAKLQADLVKNYVESGQTITAGIQRLRDYAPGGKGNEKVLAAVLGGLDNVQSKLAATGTAATTSGKQFDGFLAHTPEFGAMSDKLVELAGKFREVKTTTFEQNLRSARDEITRYVAEVEKLIAQGKVTPDDGKALEARAKAVLPRILADLSQRQLDEDAKALRGHERDIQNGLTGLIDDARVKRQSTLSQEVRDIAEKYAPAIKAALQNAQSAPAGQKASFTREAGQLQQDQIRETVVAQQKANNDLDQLDRDRAGKVRAAQQTLLGEQQKGLTARTALLVSEQQAAITSAGDSAQAQVDAARRYAPLILAAKQQELQATSQASRLQAKTDLDNSLHDAKSAGSQRGALELAARQTYLQRVRNANDTATNEYNAAQLASVKDLQDREAAVVKEATGRQLADTASLTGRQLAGLADGYRAALTAAARAGNAPVVSAYRDALKTITGLQEGAIKSFRTLSAETEKTIKDLGQKLRDAQPTGEKLAGEKTARQPFTDIIKSAQEAVKKVNEEFGKLSPADQTGARLARYRSDVATLEGQIAQARADGNAASLRSDLAYNAKRLTESNATTAALRQGELTLAQSRGQLADKVAQTDAAQLAARQNLINLAAKEVSASEQALSRLPGERAAALAAIPKQQTEERARVAAQYAQQQLTLQNDLVSKRGGLYDAVQSKVQQEVSQQARNLTLQEAQNKLLEARVPLAERSLLTAQLDVQAGQNALSSAEETLKKLQASGSGRDPVAAAELAITSAQTDLLGKREALEHQITAEVDKRAATAQLELDLAQARQRANAQITGAANDAVAAAQLDLQLTGQNLEANRKQQALLSGRKDSQDAILALQKTEADLVGTAAQQQRAVTQALKDRQLLMEGITTSEQKLGEASGQQLAGVTLATRGVLGSRDDLTAAERRYAQALADVQAAQNQTTLGAYRTATDDLTSKITAQRQAVQALADSYRQQVTEMDGVRSATDRLAALVRGPDTGKIAQGDVNAELDKLKAIQGRRDSALDTLQRAIQSGDAKRITAAENDLTTQEDRYRKQTDRVAKGTGIQISLTNEGTIADTLKQLEQLGVTYDQLSPALQAQADARDKEAKSAVTLWDAMATFAGPADRLAAALNRPFQPFTSFTPSSPALPPPTAGISNVRGGDTINISIPITLDGQPVPTPAEFRSIARDEIAAVIQGARREKAWTKDC